MQNNFFHSYMPLKENLSTFVYTRLNSSSDSSVSLEEIAEIEDPNKLKESLTNIITIVNRCYNKSWCLCQNGRRKCN